MNTVASSTCIASSVTIVVYQPRLAAADELLAAAGSAKAQRI
jgi:hypothetical protein